MKTKLLSIAIMCFISSSIFAQGFSLGIKGGANVGKISGESFKDQFTFGYHVGGFVTIPLGKKWAIQPEAMLSQVNVDTANNLNQIPKFNIDKINLQYLSIPILLNYNISKFLTIQAGPQFSILLDKNKDLLQNGKDAFKNENFALVAGLQLNLLKLRVYGRFVGGLTDINNIESSDTWKTQSIQLGVGFSLF